MHNKNILLTSLWILALVQAIPVISFSQPPLKIALAGLSHDHVHGALQAHRNNKVSIIGIAEPNVNLVQRYKQRYQLPDSIFYKDLPALLKNLKPRVVMAFNAIADHLQVVEACAPLGIHVMVEKPLAISVKQAERMAYLARQYKIELLTNYETTWYPSNHWVYAKVFNDTTMGDIRKMVVHDGHEGPKEIGVSSEFLQWLTDPEKNGAGALVDFGCYGANLMTWLMKGQQPVAVIAITKRIKPDVYPRVDDDATIILEYPQATGIIEGSWNWPFSIKDLEVFGKTGYAQAVNNNTVRIKDKVHRSYTIQQVEPGAAPYTDYFSYLAAVLDGKVKSESDLSSLQNNLVVVKILEAALRSAREGRRVLIK